MTATGSEWEPTTAELRDGESPDLTAHELRNKKAKAALREELDEERDGAEPVGVTITGPDADDCHIVGGEGTDDD